MANITPTTLAAGVGSSVENTQFVSEATVLRRKQVIVGTFDPLKTTLTAEVPFLSTSPPFTADQCGFGSMLHRLHLKNELGAQGVETWIQPQAEAGGAAAAVGELDFTGSTGILGGTLAVYISGDRIAVPVTAAMTVEELADATVTAINAVSETNFIASKTAVTFEVVLTSKTLGTYGNDVNVSLNLQADDVTPTGITSVITQPVSGSGIPLIQDALDALGIDDDANEAHFTALIQGYGSDTTTLDAIANYVGQGNEKTGLYSELVSRPFRSHFGDVATGDAGLAAAIVITDGRLLDRSQSPVSVPASESHPAEIAAQALGHMERVNGNVANQGYVDILMIGVRPGAKADRWTSSGDNRDLAVNSGISTTKVKSNQVYLQNMVTMYRPASVPTNNNGYRNMTHISTTQNVLNSQRVFFSQEKHQNLIIVSDVTKVSNVAAKKKARDVSGTMDFVVQLVKTWEGIGWIADSDFTINLLKQGGYVTIRTLSNGFDITIPVIYSGNGDIYDVTTQFDISFAALQ